MSAKPLFTSFMLAIVASCSLVDSAFAQQTQTATYSQEFYLANPYLGLAIDSDLNDYSNASSTINVPKFDDSLGELTSARVILSNMAVVYPVAVTWEASSNNRFHFWEVSTSTYVTSSAIQLMLFEFGWGGNEVLASDPGVDLGDVEPYEGELLYFDQTYTSNLDPLIGSGFWNINLYSAITVYASHESPWAGGRIDMMCNGQFGGDLEVIYTYIPN